MDAEKGKGKLTTSLQNAGDYISTVDEFLWQVQSTSVAWSSREIKKDVDNCGITYFPRERKPSRSALGLAKPN